MEQTGNLRFTALRRTNDLSDNIIEILKDRLKSCAAFSQALGERTDIFDRAHLVILIRSVTVGFDVA